MLDMGEPVLIYDLAERMIRLSGHKPGTDIAVEITGVRPGEKLAEELTALEETEHPTEHPSIRRVTPIAIERGELEHGVEELGRLATDLADAECHESLTQLALVERRSPQSSSAAFEAARSASG